MCSLCQLWFLLVNVQLERVVRVTSTHLYQKYIGVILMRKIEYRYLLGRLFLFLTLFDWSRDLAMITSCIGDHNTRIGLGRKHSVSCLVSQYYGGRREAGNQVPFLSDWQSADWRNDLSLFFQISIFSVFVLSEVALVFDSSFLQSVFYSHYIVIFQRYQDWLVVRRCVQERLIQ